MAKTLTCPSCDGSINGGTEFTMVELARGEQSYIIEGQDADGSLLAAPCDFMVTGYGSRAEIRCGDCDHVWATSRRWQQVTLLGYR